MPTFPLTNLSSRITVDINTTATLNDSTFIRPLYLYVVVIVLLYILMHIAHISTMKCSLEQCFFSYAALTYTQYVSSFFYIILILFLFSVDIITYRS